jgi:glutamate 5-kinase
MVLDEASSKAQRCRRDLKSAKLVVVKIGASSLSNTTGALDHRKIGSLCNELAKLKRRGIDVVLVSSGAIKEGKAIMRNRIKNGEIPGLQALASIGQVVLMESYRDIMASEGFNVGQILLTWDDFGNKRRLRNLLNTFNTLLSLGVIPIINENDTIAVDEIKFGDNDTLSALVAKYMQADLLVLLSDIDGLYMGDPKQPDSKLISCVENISPDIERLVSEEYSGFGGMKAKLKAAKLATNANIPIVIANGTDKKVLERIIAGEKIGTIFIPRDPHEQ